MYLLTFWKDHAVTPGNTYRITTNQDGTITLTPAGRVVQQGTNMNAANFNNLETGVFAANVTEAELVNIIRMLKDKTESLEGFVIDVTLTNSQKYPFNNSTKTVALSGANARYNKNYTVIAEIQEADGIVGDIVITDKMLNGFKIAHTGSARNVKLKCYIQGGK